MVFWIHLAIQFKNLCFFIFAWTSFKRLIFHSIFEIWKMNYHFLSLGNLALYQAIVVHLIVKMSTMIQNPQAHESKCKLALFDICSNNNVILLALYKAKDEFVATIPKLDIFTSFFMLYWILKYEILRIFNDCAK